MKSIFRVSNGFLVFSFLVPLTLVAQTVRFQTNVGNIDVQLLPGDAPKTVANFLAYVNSGVYTGSFIHRSVPRFVFQGGGYQWASGAPVAIPTKPPVVNEFNVSNTRGTVAMAKLGDDPNSADSQWFFNEVDNSADLDHKDGGFTVFGRVVDDASLGIMDQIATQNVYNLSSVLGSGFTTVPLINYTGSFTAQNLVFIGSIGVVPGIGLNGVISPSDFGGAANAAVGSFVEIYGSDLAGTTRTWSGSDFTNGNAPTSLDGVDVTVDGTPAYISYVSPGQVNVQVPAGVPGGRKAQVIVTYSDQSSAAAMLAIEPLAGAILAPTSFKVNGKQYVAAYHANNTVVTGGNIPGLPKSPAAPRETLVFYGLGFGPVHSGAPIAGQLATGQTTLSTKVQFLFGDGKLPGTVLYQGLAPGFVGLYQFNVIVPANAPNGDLALHVSQGGSDLPEKLFISVK